MTNEYITYFDFVKSQDKNSIFSNPNIEHLINAVAGNEKMQKTDSDNKEKNEIEKTYARMFFSLAIVRLCRGETLGVARQKSLEQMDSYMQFKNKPQNPLNEHMAEFKGKFNPEIAKINMKDKNNAEKKLNIDSATAKELEEIFSKEFKQCLKKINEMMQKHDMEQTVGKATTEKAFEDEKQHETQKLDSVQQKNQQLIKQLLLQQVMRQRAA